MIPSDNGLVSIARWFVRSLIIPVACASIALGATIAAADTTLTDINARLAAFAAVVNSKTSTTLLSSDLLPYFDADFMQDGFNREEKAAQFANFLQDSSNFAASVTQLTALSADAAGATAHTIGSMYGNAGGEPFIQLWDGYGPNSGMGSYHLPVNGSWGLYGNQRIANAEIRTPLINQQCGGSCDAVRRFRAFQAWAKSGTIQSVAVSGENSAFQDTEVPLRGTMADGGLSSDYFSLWPSEVTSFPDSGSAYTFTVTPISGDPVQYLATVAATTAETIQVTNPTGHALADAKLDAPLSVSWSLPGTFAVSKVDLEVNTRSSAGSCNPVALYGMQPGTGSRIITIPSQCNGQPLADRLPEFPVEIRVTVHGVNGE